MKIPEILLNFLVFVISLLQTHYSLTPASIVIFSINIVTQLTKCQLNRLDTVLGAGGFGITYRAYDANLDKFVAIKEYLPVEFVSLAENHPEFR